MPRRIWLGTVHLEYATEEAPLRLRRAFTNVTTWACDLDEFVQKSEQMLEHYGWRLLGVEEARPVDESQEFEDEMRKMIERTRKNPSAVIYGAFHTYPRGPATT